MNWNIQELIGLGAGGPRPRLDLISPEDLSRVTATYPSLKGSIYAFDFAPDGSEVVIGTRNGDVHSLRLVGSGSSPACEWSVRALPHKVVGITQLLCVSQETVCILNESGAGWCCNPNSEAPAMSFMETGNRKLVALCRIEDDQILGFTEDGMLLVWRNHEWDSPECFHQIPACWNNLHARPIQWSAAGAVIYPSPGRQLAVLDMTRMKSSLRTPDACAVDCLSVDDNVLLTVDARARSGRLWDIDFNPIRRVDGLPADLVQCVLLDAKGTSVLAVDKAGNAALLDFSGKRAHVVSRLPGSDYRLCAVLPRRIRLAAHEQRIRSEATRAAYEALNAMGRGETAHSSLNILDATGYQQVSRALRADAAEKNDDIAEAIRLTRKQIESIPPDSPSAEDTLRRYCRLLSKEGLLPLYERSESSRASNTGTSNRGGPCTHSHDSHDVPNIEMMNTPYTMEILCECATAADIPVAGYWFIKSLPAINCGDTHVTPVQFSEKYNGLGISQRGGPLKASPVTIHSANTLQGPIRHAVFFQAAQEGSSHLFLNFDSKSGFSTVEPIVAFRASSIPAGVGVAEHNARVLADFHHLMGSDATKAQLAELIRTSTHVLRRIITEAQSQCVRKAKIQ